MYILTDEKKLHQNYSKWIMVVDFGELCFIMGTLPYGLSYYCDFFFKPWPDLHQEFLFLGLVETVKILFHCLPEKFGFCAFIPRMHILTDEKEWRQNCSNLMMIVVLEWYALSWARPLMDCSTIVVPVMRLWNLVLIYTKIFYSW